MPGGSAGSFYSTSPVTPIDRLLRRNPFVVPKFLELIGLC